MTLCGAENASNKDHYSKHKVLWNILVSFPKACQLQNAMVKHGKVNSKGSQNNVVLDNNTDLSQEHGYTSYSSETS